ncbi:MAG: 2-oxoglutarate dehydrogenase complex dihydrolipoyllysine-residue succinyltransferase [Bdellovibrionales bacterium]
MKQEIKIPNVAESITEVDVSEWMVSDGDVVNKDDIIVVLDSDKASLELPSDYAGKLEIVVAEGETVEPGTLIAYVDTSVSADAGSTASSKENDSSTTSSQSAPTGNSGITSPAAGKLIQEKGVDASSVSGTGKDGRITKQDVLAHQPAASSSPKIDTTPTVDPSSLEVPRPASSHSGERETRKKMPSIRRKIASRLVMAQHTAAILTTFNEIDMSASMNLRTKYKEAFEKKHGVRLGFMSLFTKAVTEAMKDFPDVNSYIDGMDLVKRNYYDISIAVGGPKGLVVPVVRDADLLSLADIEKTIKVFAKKAQANALSIDDMTGGGFTISNGGVFGSLLSTPILNPPQTGILGLHKIEERPVVINGEITIRPMMYVAMSYDHRVIDGKQSVGFLVKIKEIMEDPTRILLEM